jgi:hypothetical protein
MQKPLHEHLADLSERAKKAEDAIRDARRETREKVAARREEARVAAAAAVDRVNEDIRTVGDEIAGQFNALRSKITDDLERLKAERAERQREKTVDRAESRAARKEEEASLAIDFALASIEDAKLAVLDAVIADIEADEVRRMR